jgi:molybdopterin-containing oxidoreductase family membrane subunit
VSGAPQTLAQGQEPQDLGGGGAKDTGSLPLIERDMLASWHSGRWYWLGLFAAIAVTAIGGWCYAEMVREGLGITGLNSPVMWGSMITTFVFFIGVSHSGTLVSAILYFARSPLRASIGRSAEAMTVIAIMTGGLYPILHMGHPWLFFWFLPLPNQRHLWLNYRSPLAWDVFAIASYVTISALFLYMGMLPDLAILARRVAGWRRVLYRMLSLGFAGTEREWAHYERAYPIFAGIAIPLAVSVHSVVSWDFAMALTPGWHSTIFAPYFVAGAIFSGIAMAIILLAGMRRGFKLQAHIRIEHFSMLARLLVAMSLVMTLVYATEFFMAFYRGGDAEREIFMWRISGPYAPVFWGVVLCNCIAPLPCFSPRVRNSLPAMIAIAILVTVGMWFERYMFVVTSLAHSFNPAAWHNYRPTLRELAICLGGFGWFTTLFLLFVKIFPSVSVAETLQGQAESAAGYEGVPHAR